MKILVVDDEPNLLEQVRGVLEKQKYSVDTAADGEAAIDKLFDQVYDLIILDIMLPKIDGWTVLKEARSAKIRTPVLMLTAMGEIDDKIKGLDMGADDYLAKPFSVAELLARIRALFRRGSDHRTATLEAGDLRLNTVTREVRKGAETISLTPKEFSILEFLLYNKNRVVSRSSLAEHVWGEDFDPFSMSNSIDVHTKNLRHKIGDAAGAVIRTVRGLGYIIRDGDA